MIYEKEENNFNCAWIEVNVNGLSVLYERDEGRIWRAIVDPSQLEKNQSVQTELLQAIADSIGKILS